MTTGCSGGHNLYKELVLRPLQLAGAGSTGEGEYISDVGDAGYIHQQSLKTQSEAGMRGPAEAPQVHIPLVALYIHAQLSHARRKLFRVILTLRTAYYLADSGHQ